MMVMAKFRLYGFCAAVAVGFAQLPSSTVSVEGWQATPTLERFFTIERTVPAEYRALRHLSAKNDRFHSAAWMDVWTQADACGFQYQIAAEGGSDYIRSHVFREALETEQRSWASNAAERAAFTTLNYAFDEDAIEPDGLVRVTVKPRRKDLLLVDGSIFLRSDNADLVRVEGRLSKSPSFWTRGVDVVRHYERVAGVRMPVMLETTSNILVAGRSMFTMQWEYESVNGERVGSPKARTSASIYRPVDCASE